MRHNDRGSIRLPGHPVAGINTINSKSRKRRRCKDTSKKCKYHGDCAHTSQECRVLNKKRSNYVTIPICTASDIKHSRYMLPVTFRDGSSVTALVDTGADVLCIHSDLARKIKLSVDSRSFVKTADSRNILGFWTNDLNLQIFSEIVFQTIISRQSVMLDCFRPRRY
ncbi:hypothetical protein PAEPH01_1834 [Pancytospora epiphaga]|nr:hypothetical protein PAEPH01_1834 [Pancytospora epiphaga]